jgi:hypothetical protein
MSFQDAQVLKALISARTSVFGASGAALSSYRTDGRHAGDSSARLSIEPTTRQPL